MVHACFSFFLIKIRLFDLLSKWFYTSHCKTLYSLLFRVTWMERWLISTRTTSSYMYIIDWRGTWTVPLEYEIIFDWHINLSFKQQTDSKRFNIQIEYIAPILHTTFCKIFILIFLPIAALCIPNRVIFNYRNNCWYLFTL